MPTLAPAPATGAKAPARKSPKIGATKQAHRVKRVRRALRSDTALKHKAAIAAILPSRLRARNVVKAATARAASSSLAGTKLDASPSKASRHAAPPPSPPAEVALPPKPRPPHKDKPFRTEGLFAGDYPHRLPLSEHPLILASLNVRRKTPTRKSLDGRKPAPAATRTASEMLLPTEYAKGFPPLPYTWLASKPDDEEDFLLPFDIVYDWEQGDLGSKKVPQKYVKVKKNIYVDRKPHSNPEISAICHCEPSSGCGEHCLNRAMSFTCGETCPCGEGCTNQPLHSRRQSPYKIAWTGQRGFGVFATAPIRKGDFIMDYRGEVIEMNTYYARIRSVYQGRKDFYALAYDADDVIDAGLKGNDARFVNHSCGPNLMVRKLQTMGQGSEEFEVGFWAERDIDAGEELFYNYNFDSFTTIVRPANHPDFLENPVERRQKCFCGAETCSGWLGKKATDKVEEVETAKKAVKAKTSRTKEKGRLPKAVKAVLKKSIRGNKAPVAKVIKQAGGRVQAAAKKALLRSKAARPAPAPRPARRGAADTATIAKKPSMRKASTRAKPSATDSAAAAPAVLARIVTAATSGAAPATQSTRALRGRTSSRSSSRPHNLGTLPATLDAPQIRVSACSSVADSLEETPSLTTGPSRSSVALDDLPPLQDEDFAVASSSASDDMGRVGGPQALRPGLEPAQTSNPVVKAGLAVLTAIATEAPVQATELIVASAHIAVSFSHDWPGSGALGIKPLTLSIPDLFGLTGKPPAISSVAAQLVSLPLNEHIAAQTRTSASPSVVADAEQAPDAADNASGAGASGQSGNAPDATDADQSNVNGSGEGGDQPAGDGMGIGGFPDGNGGEDPNEGGSGQEGAGDLSNTSEDDDSSGDDSDDEQGGEGPSLDQPPSPTSILNSALAMNGGYIPEDLTLDSLSRQPDLSAFAVHGLNLPDMTGELNDLTARPAKKRKGKSRQAQVPPDEMSPHEIAQRMVDEVARSAARAEKRRLRREAETNGKKRRNKWHLPLETEQLEIERKKKKKGQKWMEAMKTLVEQKRAAAGLPVPEPSTQRPTADAPAETLNDIEQPTDDAGATAGVTGADHDSVSGDDNSVHGAETASTLSEDTQAEGVEVDVDQPTPKPGDPPAKPKPKRIRKPRPPRRFKTTLTRLRPKLEAALSSVSIEEEEAALERERRRRKKGTAWLEAMKALARAKREAAEAAEQGLPPPDFVLPPTSLPPTGRRRSKKSRQPGDEHDPEDSDEEHSLPLVDTQAEVAALMPPGRQSLIEEPLDADLPGGIPAFMFPPDHPAAQAHRREETQSSAEQAGLQEYLDPNIMADAAAAAAAFAEPREEATQPVDPPANQFPEYVPQFQPHESDQGQVDYAPASSSDPTSQFVQPEYRFDDQTAQYSEHAFQQPTSSAVDDHGANGYQPNFSNLPLPPPSFNLPNFDAFTAQQVQPQPVEQSLPQMLPAPVMTHANNKPSETQKANGEKRKRGPPVKKIAGSTLVPLTDEQWEAERKKRKKGYNWVAETKAAAAAEREQLNLARSGIKLPRKPKGQRAAANALAAAAVAVAEEASQDQSYLEHDEQQHEDLPFTGLDLQSLQQSAAHSATPGQEVAPEPDDVLPYPTMSTSLMQDQPYPALNQSFDNSSGQNYGLDMYNPTDDVEGYGSAATADQIYNAMHPYRHDGE